MLFLQRTLSRRTHVAGCISPAESGESSVHSSSLRRGFKPQTQNAVPRASAAGTPAGKLVLGADEFSLERWLEVDKKLNKYPEVRTFTAIGTGGDEFKTAMVQAVESATGRPVAGVSDRLSSQGAYVSVKIDVLVASVEEVIEVFAKLKADSRLKWVM